MLVKSGLKEPSEKFQLLREPDYLMMLEQKPKVEFNECYIRVAAEDQPVDVRQAVERLCQEIDPALENAPIHHWHGRRAIYITIELDEPLAKDAVLLSLKQGAIRGPQGQTWRDLQGEHGLEHRIQLVYVAHLTSL